MYLRPISAFDGILSLDFTIDGSDCAAQVESAEKGIGNAKKNISTAQDRIASYAQRMAETEEKRSDYHVTGGSGSGGGMPNFSGGGMPGGMGGGMGGRP